MNLNGLTDKWWLNNFKVADIWSKGITGKGIKIAVLDTGISYPHTALDLNPDLFMDVTKSASGAADLNGHGTHCAGIIKASRLDTGPVGVAYNATMYLCKITHDDFGDIDDYLIQGIKWAIAQHVDIISISKGNPFEDKNIESAIIEADNQGILVVAAAGNKTPEYPDDHIYYPARYCSLTHTISVGGVDENNLPLSDTLLTNETEIYGPGFEILSTYLNNGFSALSGSSQAAPFIAGICALILEKARKTDPAFSANKIKEILLQNALTLNFGKVLSTEFFFI
jgi:subtilisin family serine protease